MRVVVKKYGGTSVKDLDCIRGVADSIARGRAGGETVVAVVSAMAGVTNQLVTWSRDITGEGSYSPEADVVCASGEQVTAGLLALALNERGIKARSWLGWQLPIITTEETGNADILSIGLDQVRRDLQEGIVPVIAGFQGMTSEGRLTTLGRGGSDTTAVAVAAELRASHCQIFTDVQGVYRVDPAYMQDSYYYSDMSYDDMVHLAEHGGRVLHVKAACLAQDRRVPVQILSSFDSRGGGTWIRDTSSCAINIAQKPVLRWTLSSQEVCDLYARLEGARVRILDWYDSGSSLSFLTWADAYDRVSLLLPPAVIPERKVLVTFLGPSSTLLDLPKRGEAGIEQTLTFSYARGFVVDEENVARAMALVYQKMISAVSLEAMGRVASV